MLSPERKIAVTSSHLEWFANTHESWLAILLARLQQVETEYDLTTQTAKLYLLYGTIGSSKLC